MYGFIALGNHDWSVVMVRAPVILCMCLGKPSVASECVITQLLVQTQCCCVHTNHVVIVGSAGKNTINMVRIKLRNW